MSNWALMSEMGKRVGLPLPIVGEIYYLGLQAALNNGSGELDMVVMANAIKYASENSHNLIPRWRNLIPR